MDYGNHSKIIVDVWGRRAHWGVFINTPPCDDIGTVIVPIKVNIRRDSNLRAVSVLFFGAGIIWATVKPN
jgi:hypothetical protein